MPPAIRQTGMVPLDLGPGAQLVLEARDPNTGAEVAGVEVSGIIVYADDHPGGGAGTLDLPKVPVVLAQEV